MKRREDSEVHWTKILQLLRNKLSTLKREREGETSALNKRDRKDEDNIDEERRTKITEYNRLK